MFKHALFASILASMSVAAIADESSAKRRDFTVVAIGDSITQAYNSKTFLSSSPEISWSTGESRAEGFNSHVLQLRKLLPDFAIKGYNVAKVGAVMTDAERQVGLALQKNPDYVTFMIGANDVCNWPDNHADKLAAFSNNVTRQLDRLVEANPDINVLLVPIPDIYHLWYTAKDNGSCRQIWSLAGICEPLLGSRRTQAQREQFRQRWRDANAALEQAAALHPAQVFFPANLADYSFGPDHVSSYDCFHPSVKGQKLISDLTWHEWWSFAGESISSIH